MASACTCSGEAAEGKRSRSAKNCWEISWDPEAPSAGAPSFRAPFMGTPLGGAVAPLTGAGALPFAAASLAPMDERLEDWPGSRVSTVIITACSARPIQSQIF